jgi:hypothetical protein
MTLSEGPAGVVVVVGAAAVDGAAEVVAGAAEFGAVAGAAGLGALV